MFNFVRKNYPKTFWFIILCQILLFVTFFSVPKGLGIGPTVEKFVWPGLFIGLFFLLRSIRCLKCHAPVVSHNRLPIYETAKCPKCGVDLV